SEASVGVVYPSPAGPPQAVHASGAKPGPEGRVREHGRPPTLVASLAPMVQRGGTDPPPPGAASEASVGVVHPSPAGPPQAIHASGAKPGPEGRVREHGRPPTLVASLAPMVQGGGTDPPPPGAASVG